MKLEDLRIVFMGTPDFAVPSLEALLQAQCNVVAVVTAPDKPAGRGLKPMESAVKKAALQYNLPVLQPEKLKDNAFIQQLKTLQPHLQVVVAFRMLPEAVWRLPPMGTINLHASLLPQYRGAAPINWAIIHGEKQTGLTTFQLQQEIDTGEILLQETLSIGEEETAGELHDRMKIIGAQLVVKTVKGLSDGSLKPYPQPVLKTPLYAAPKITTEMCRIHWQQKTENVFNLICGLSPYPAAFTYLHNKLFKIIRSKKLLQPHSLTPGTYETDKKTYLRFACTDGFISATEVQMEGKKKMLIEDFLRGYRFS